VSPGEYPPQGFISIGDGAPPYNSTPFTGLADELALYSRTLTQQEIRWIYLAGANGKLPTPVLAPLPRVQAFGFWDGFNLLNWDTVPPLYTGDHAAFALFSQGTGLSYQWLKDEEPLGGASQPDLVKSSVTLADPGFYTVKVTGSGRTIESPWAYLPVREMPEIPADEPHDQLVTAGQTASFSVNATGPDPLTYQWYYIDQSLNWFPIAGATSPTLILTDVHEPDDGFYVVEVADQWGDTAQSRGATLTTTPDIAPSITVQPQPQTVLSGGNTAFTVTATGTPPFTYQWQFNDSDISGATSSALTLASVQSSQAGNYRVIVQNTAGSATSDEAVLAIAQSTNPIIMMQPRSYTVIVGTDVPLKVTALSAPPTTYQWRKNGTDIPGATGSVLLLQNVIPSDGATYQVLVQNNYGPTLSGNAVLTVTQVPLPPVVITPDHSATLPATVKLSVPGYPNATIYYTLDGTTPTTSSSTYSAASPPTITTRKTIAAFATQQYYVNSGFSATVMGDAHSPTAAADIFQVQQDAPATQLDVIANDTDPDGDPLTISGVVQPTHGTVTFTIGTAGLTYQPAAGFFGIDAFSYTITDGNGGAATATATVFVMKQDNAAPNPPTRSIVLGVNVLAGQTDIRSGSSDPDGDIVSIYCATPPKIGSLAIGEGLGTLSYARDAGTYVSQLVTCTLTDGNGGCAGSGVFIANLDSDSDGMPDEWELAHNLDPNDATDASADPDGDGIPNLSEFQLGTDPNTPDNPITLTILNNPSILSGDQPIQVTVTGNLKVDATTLELDSGTTMCPLLYTDPTDTTILHLNTRQLGNGAHTIQAAVSIATGDSQMFRVFSAPQPVNIFNEISFAPVVDNLNVTRMDGWDQSFEYGPLKIDALAQRSPSSGAEPVDYQIQIFSGSDPATPIKTISGHSADGLIHEEWNLVDNGGQSRADDVFLSQITAAWGGPSPHAASTSTPGSAKKDPDWPLIGGWVVAYQNVAWGTSRSKNQCYKKLERMAGMLEQRHIEMTSEGYKDQELLYPIYGTQSTDRQQFHPMFLNFNDEVIDYIIQNRRLPGPPPAQNKAFQARREGQWANLKNALGDRNVRNFWLMAHGNPTPKMGADVEGTDGSPRSAAGWYTGSKSYLEASDVARILGNGTETVPNPDGSKTTIPKLKHPFRFVFMHGCLSAVAGTTPNWQSAFGIDQVYHEDPTAYQNSAKTSFVKRPSTFLGWDFSPPLTHKAGLMDPGPETFGAKLVDYWVSSGFGGKSIATAVQQAFDDAQSAGGDWATICRPHLIKSGYGGLHFDEANQNDMNDPQCPD
jgi:hypothetical protein